MAAPISAYRFTIRPATAQDIPAIQAVCEAAWHDTYTALVPPGYIEAGLRDYWQRDGLERSITDPDGRLFVAENASAIVGMARMHFRERSVGRLQQLYLRNEARRQGIGRTLWQMCVQSAPADVQQYLRSVVQGTQRCTSMSASGSK